MHSVMEVYLAKRDSTGDEAYATLSLPAGPHEILDALEKVRPDGPNDVDLMVEEYYGYEYLAKYILPQPDLYGLNALAEKLSELTDDETIAFHGLVQMEAGKQDGQLSLQRLLDLAYSADCCHVVDALNDGQLGRFYAENGFVPETDSVPDSIFEYLDFEQIGRRMRKGEDGTFVERSTDGPGGYVVRHSELKQAPPIPTGPPRKPDYVFRLNMELLPPGEKKAVEISLPATDEQIKSALDTLGVPDLSYTMGDILDSPLPALKSRTFFDNDILTANKLAELIQDMSETDLGTLKAAVEVFDATKLNDVMELAGRIDEYSFDPGIRGIEQAVEAELNKQLGEKDADLIIQHVNLYAYGKALLEQHNIAVTAYGRLERVDGQPIQAMEHEPEMGGMEAMM